MKTFSSKVFAVQHAIDLCLKRKTSMKKLIVALEWSENDKILAEILRSVEQQSEVKDSLESCPRTENDSEMLEGVGTAVIKMEVMEELENVEQNLMIPAAEMNGSLDQAPTEAPQEMPSDDQVPASGNLIIVTFRASSLSPCLHTYISFQNPLQNGVYVDLKAESLNLSLIPSAKNITKTVMMATVWPAVTLMPA